MSKAPISLAIRPHLYKTVVISDRPQGARSKIKNNMPYVTGKSEKLEFLEGFLSTLCTWLAIAFFLSISLAILYIHVYLIFSVIYFFDTWLWKSHH